MTVKVSKPSSFFFLFDKNSVTNLTFEKYVVVCYVYVAKLKENRDFFSQFHVFRTLK